MVDHLSLEPSKESVVYELCWWRGMYTISYSDGDLVGKN
jgi:hypothetical protein